MGPRIVEPQSFRPYQKHSLITSNEPVPLPGERRIIEEAAAVESLQRLSASPSPSSQPFSPPSIRASSSVPGLHTTSKKSKKRKYSKGPECPEYSDYKKQKINTPANQLFDEIIKHSKNPHLKAHGRKVIENNTKLIMERYSKCLQELKEKMESPPSTTTAPSPTITVTAGNPEKARIIFVVGDEALKSTFGKQNSEVFMKNTKSDILTPSANTFKIFHNYMNSDKKVVPTIDQANLVEMYELAVRFQDEELKNTCQRYLEGFLNLDQIFELLKMTENHESLHKIATNYLLENISGLPKHPAITKITEEQLASLIKLIDPQPGLISFEIAGAWLAAQIPKNRPTLLPEVISFLNLSKIGFDDIWRAKWDIKEDFLGTYISALSLEKRKLESRATV